MENAFVARIQFRVEYSVQCKLSGLERVIRIWCDVNCESLQNVEAGMGRALDYKENRQRSRLEEITLVNVAYEVAAKS